MEWPNDEFWGALNDETFQIFDCGELILPTGRLLACDPNVYLGSSDPNLGCRVNITPGRYPVKLTGEREGDSGPWRVWYASLILSSELEVRRKHICCAPNAEGGIAYLSDGVTREGVVEHFTGFPVETGTACLVDEGALVYGMPPDSSLWKAHIFARIDEEGVKLYNFLRRRETSDEELLKEHPEWANELARMNKERPASGLDGYSLPESERWDYRRHKSQLQGGAVNIELPLARNGANIIIFSSGMGDGSYPLVAGFDAMGQMTAIHIDFAGPNEPDDELSDTSEPSDAE